MAEELGRLERPAASNYQDKRKLYVVACYYKGGESSPEYVERLERYWRQVEEHIAGLEVKLGPVARFYHEGVDEAGEAGLKLLEQLSPQACTIIRARLNGGVTLEALEDGPTLREFMDWERMLFLGFTSETVAQTVSRFYTDASRKRHEQMARRIDETLKAPEAGVLFIREGHRIQFAQDIEVFLVSPPALEELRRWLREQAEERGKQGPAATVDR
jgi:hypothetical protein